MIKRVKLFEFDFISEREVSPVVDDILNADSYEKVGHFPFVITPNVDDIVKFSKDENNELRSYFLKSIYILPDGQPIVWASKLFFKQKIAKRLPGSDLLPSLLDKSKSKCNILALISADKIAEALKENNPNVICYTLPLFDKNDVNAIAEITDNCIKILSANDIKIVIIGVSFPKQNILAINIYNKLKALKIAPMPLFCMLGASFEFYLGIKSRAPLYVQKAGLEWLHRFASEPKRLFRRYFIEGMAFFPILVKELKEKQV
jgi:N-acetylglucosaminyldiphosphoundecaprenol N-acetyl-beta-D-mannosaminyltransferase